MTVQAGGAGGLWDKVRADYNGWVLLAFFTALAPFAYFVATALPYLMFLAGVLCLGHLNPGKGGAIRSFLPVAALSAAILILAFLRSDFVDMIVHGKGIGEAYAMSTRYFQAPMLMWFTTWAVVCAAWNLKDAPSHRAITWLAWLFIGLAFVQLGEAISGIGLRNWMNMTFFHNGRPEMVVVKSSNFNAILLMLFWPLSFWFMQRRQVVPILLMAVAILWAAVAVDTNAHILVLVAGYVVFLVARYWPNDWSRRGILPERILAGATVAVIGLFPVLILFLMRTGLAWRIRDHLPASWAARIDIWTYAAARCLEKPVFGWGYESARHFEPHIPNHPHNLSMQAWLELGIPGLLLLAAFWFCIFWFITPRNASSFARPDENAMIDFDNEDAESQVIELPAEQRARPYMLAAVSGYFLLNVISYGMWRAWLYCLGALMVVVAVMVIKAVRADMKLRI